MNLLTLLEMVSGGYDDRIAVGSLSDGTTYAQLRAAAARGGARIQASGAKSVIFCGENGPAFPIALFAASFAGVQFLPLNYRLAEEYIHKAIMGMPAPYIVTDNPSVVPEGSAQVVETFDDWLAATTTGDVPVFDSEPDPEDIAILLQTSGTTSAPKSAVLRHKHLVAYVLGSVDFASAEPSDAMIVSVPPYHIAGISAILSGTYSGRRIVYMPQFEPAKWVNTAREEGITHAMVVPTMLDRILDEVERQGQTIPTLQHLSYGGGRMPIPVIERAMTLLPSIGFVNAYGLTETSSTVAILTPDDHRVAVASSDPAVRSRLGSVGQPLPGLEVKIVDDLGNEVPAGAKGEIWVRGEQVSGEYEGLGATLTADGWFPTKDGGFLDDEGYLYVEGRLDDVIVRGGENLSPGEIEDVLLTHTSVADCGIIGVPDQEWGEVVCAFVVLEDGASASADELCEHVVAELRSSRRPAVVLFVDELPYNDTGKLLRRVLREQYDAVNG